MPDYNFTVLSDYEFEILARDLIQKELLLRLESFTSGRDNGIDLRCSSAPGDEIIVQCKHYAKSGFTKLDRVLKGEIAKITMLAPARYILVTSVEMTPNRKARLANTLRPYCLGPQDIFGKEDLNNLLGKHPEIERQHIKLWLSSLPVLQQVLHARIFRESDSEIDAIRRRIGLYVENNSLTTAWDILERYHYCLITGIPGIGKSSLAEMVLARYLQEGYQVFRLWDDVAEARDVYDPNVKQAFYYDDFLGKTRFQHFRSKNEDARLVRFMDDVRRSRNTRFVLTTREYILEQAKRHSETLDQAELEVQHCIVDLEGYTRTIRAKILYNHIYFSDLPYGIKDAFSNEAVYGPVIQHLNFNPRVVEWMTRQFNNYERLPANEFLERFLSNLADPIEIWRHAFVHHLSDQARNLLLVLASVSNICVEDLAIAFESYHEQWSRLYQVPRSPYHFRQALKELDGTFITMISDKDKTIVGFHNPSIQDFLNRHLSSRQVSPLQLVQAAVFPEQIQNVHDICGAGLTDDELRSMLVHLDRVFDDERPALINENGDWSREPMSYESRFLLGQRIWTSLDSPPLPSIWSMTSKLLSALEDDVLVRDCESLVFILHEITRGEVPGQATGGNLHNAVLEIIIALVDDDPPSMYDWLTIAETIDDDWQLSPSQLETLQQAFRSFAEETIASLSKEAPITRFLIWDDLDFIARYLEVNLGQKFAALHGRIMKSASKQQQADKKTKSKRQPKDLKNAREALEIQRMFDGLRSSK